MYKYSIIFFTLLTICSNIFSQTITVVEKFSGNPIENVAIYNKNRNISTLTKSDGKADICFFSLSDSLYFQHRRYKPLVLNNEYIKKVNYIVSLEVENFLLEEFVVSASKSKEKKNSVAYMTDFIDSRNISILSSNTSAEILSETGNIIVQKSQGGGGSPIIRGFEANKILLVFDGVRMNNAIYRSGHLQNAITIDNSILEKTEIVYGPSSVMYGSDAIGGVISYSTKEPKLSTNESTISDGRVELSLLSHGGRKGHIDYTFGKSKFASLSSITVNSFADIVIGENRKNYEDDFGKCFHLVETFSGHDSTLINNNPNVLFGTAYKQYDFLQKFLIQISEKEKLITNFQFSNSSSINRYDKLNDYDGENLKYAEYYYGPQKRFLSSIELNSKKSNKWFSEYTGILSWQKIDEDRISRKFGIEDRLIQNEDLKILTGTLDLLKNYSDSNVINYGFEINYNLLSSTAKYVNIFESESFLAQTRYPDGGSFTQNYSTYFRYKFYLSDKNIFSLGFRYSLSKLKSEFKDSSFINLPFSSINILTGAPTGSFSFIHRFSNDFRINTIISTAYRIPNVDDYGKIREKIGLVTIPNDKLKPEYAYNFELGLVKKIYKKFEFQAVVYSTFLTDAIVRSFYTINGEDSIVYDGEMCRIITNVNADKALISGASISLKAQLSKNISLKSNINFTKGRTLTDTINQPLGHIPPVFSQTNITHTYKKINSQISFIYHAWKHIEDFSIYGEDNESEATELGFPSWYSFNAKISYEINEFAKVNLSANNILDQYYKVFASGVSSPGRNFTISFVASF